MVGGFLLACVTDAETGRVPDPWMTSADGTSEDTGTAFEPPACPPTVSNSGWTMDFNVPYGASHTIFNDLGGSVFTTPQLTYLEWGDLNGDGELDIVINEEGPQRIHYGPLKPGVLPQTSAHDGVTNFGFFEGYGGVGDVDGNGVDDLLLQSAETDVFTLIPGPVSGWVCAEAVAGTLQGHDGADNGVLADLDADGLQDWLLLKHTNVASPAEYLGFAFPGAGQEARELLTFEYVCPGVHYSVETDGSDPFADLNADGVLDLVFLVDAEVWDAPREELVVWDQPWITPGPLVGYVASQDVG